MVGLDNPHDLCVGYGLWGFFFLKNNLNGQYESL